MDTLSANGGAPVRATVSPHTAAELKEAVLAKLTYSVGKIPKVASQRDWFLAVAFATRDIVVDHWLRSTTASYADGRKRVYYLSLEFLIGRLLFDAMTNLGIVEPMREALEELGVNLSALREAEPDAALGNGGLGRLAACFMDSMSTLSIAAHGYGIRYDNGLFRQIIRDGWQQEVPEDWLANGNPWEFERPEISCAIGFGGWVEMVQGEDDRTRHIWHPAETVEAVGYDTPIVGWRGAHVNTLRLWSARAPDPFKLDAFNAGDFIGALSDTVRAEAISKVLYPSDATPAGQELRLRQEYFFTSASLLDLIRRHIKQHQDVRTLGQHAAVQLNDTHPAIAIPELMRILVDLNGLEWDEAWAIVQATFAYTNHTLLPESLESWPVPLMERLLPRHMQIIYLLNAAHLDSARRRGFIDPGMLTSLSLIDEQAGRRVRMGNLAFIGSHKINGVSTLHTELMRKTVFHDLNTVYPDRIVNKTNGITFRRWLIECNPGLTGIIRSTLGERALFDAEALKGFAAYAADPSMQERVTAARRDAKVALTRHVADVLAQRINPDAMFDVQIKRIHEYKRQLLNILETVARYNAIRANPTVDFAPRVKIFSGKAAASYTQAKLTIKLANDVAKVVNSDPDRARSPEGRVPAQLQRLPRRADHPGRRPLRTDLDRGDGGLRHRQHEDGAQFRPHDRHARRRQSRVAQSGRRRQHFHFRPDRFRGREGARRGDRRNGADRRLADVAGGARPDRLRRVLERRCVRATGVSSTRSPTTTISWFAPISTPTGRRR